MTAPTMARSIVCRVYNFRTGKRRTLPRPIYDLSPDGATALTHDFERMKHSRELIMSASRTNTRTSSPPARRASGR